MRSFTYPLAVLLQLACSSIFASAQNIPESLAQVAPTPKWVEMNEMRLVEEIPVDDISDGEYFHNIELQWHIPSKTKFYRTVFQVVSEAGLEGNGERTFTFDPEYETQRIHWVRIIRDGEIISDYQPQRLRLYNTESDMASRMLNGSLTALVILEDLRVGDIVDLASSVQGANPAFGEHAVLNRSLHWSVPVGRQLTRILADADDKLQVHAFLEKPPVTSTVQELGLKEWRHELIESPPVRREPSVPAHVRVYGALHASSFENWGKVADWATDLYPMDVPLPNELHIEAERITNQFKTDKERAAEALFYIQGNVRYLGLEMGHGAYQPREPELVWKRRFGDCKDKALLLVRMLQTMGIDAVPALVNTAWDGGIVDFLPSPIAFNHVIVCADIEGRKFWLDPTYNRQFGPLDKLPIDNYGYALLIRKAEKGLTPVADHPEYDNFISVKTKLTVGAPGEESSMEVTTRYGGREAAQARQYFQSTSINEIGKSYTEYWAGEYPHPELKSPVEYTEFPSLAEVETVEHYTIPDTWEASDSEKDKKLYFNFSPATLKGKLDFPQRIKRKYPYQLDAPISVVDAFEVHLFEPWNYENDQLEISGPAIEYSNKTDWGSVVNATYKLEIKDSVIPADEVMEFEATMGKINDDLGWKLNWDPNFVPAQDDGVENDAPVKYDNLLAYLLYGFGMMLAVVIALPFFLKQRLKPPKLIPEDCAEYEGLGGWLILPILGLFSTPLAILAQIFGEDLAWIFDQAQWDTVSESFPPAMMNVVGFECIYNGFLLIAPVALLIMLFQRRWFLPPLMIAFYILQPVFLIVDASLYSMLGSDLPATGDPSDIVSGVVTALIWGFYFGVSKRVKATFRS